MKKRSEKQRRGLLAKVHIAIKDLCIDDGTYREILRREFGVASAAALSNRELEALVRYFKRKGWQAKSSPPDRRTGKARDPEAQVDALRERALELKEKMQMSERRFRGLCRKICGAERIEWCQDGATLKRLLAVMEKIRRSS